MVLLSLLALSHTSSNNLLPMHFEKVTKQRHGTVSHLLVREQRKQFLFP